MNKEDCQYKSKWNYKPCSGYYQNDWNQTLLSRINEISSQIHRTTQRPGNTVELNPILRPFIETLEFYNSFTLMISNKFNVKYNENIEYGVIYVYNDIVKSTQIKTIPIMEIGGNDMPVINFIPIRSLHHTIVTEFKRKCCGYVRVENYFKFLSNRF